MDHPCASFPSGGLTEAAIAGIVIGVLVAILLIAAVVFFVMRNQQKKEKQDPCLQSANAFNLSLNMANLELNFQ